MVFIQIVVFYGVIMRFYILFFVILVLKFVNCIIGCSGNKKFIKLCFDGDEIENMCLELSDFCCQKLGMEFKFVYLDGFKVR